MFKKKKKESVVMKSAEEIIYDTLKQLSGKLELQDNAFILPDQQIFIYADVLGCDDHTAQVIFQIHHDVLEDPIIDSVCGVGETREACLQDACENFYMHDVAIFLQALSGPTQQQVKIHTQEDHLFDFYASGISSHGKREGNLPDSFWEWLKDDILKRLGNKRLYWVKIYCAMADKNNEVEVRINNVKSRELGNLLREYVIGWDCLDTFHTEKQCFLFLQKEETYIPPVFTKEMILQQSSKAIELFEKCKNLKHYRKLRMQLIKHCKDESLGMELFGFIPELYCKYAYSDLEFGDQLFLIQKGKQTQELYQSQVRSFYYIEEAVRKHLHKDEVSQKVIDKVVEYSANYHAVQKALDENEDEEVDRLYTPGIGYFVKEGYILR